MVRLRNSTVHHTVVIGTQVSSIARRERLCPWYVRRVPSSISFTVSTSLYLAFVRILWCSTIHSTSIEWCSRALVDTNRIDSRGGGSTTGVSGGGPSRSANWALVTASNASFAAGESTYGRISAMVTVRSFTVVSLRTTYELSLRRFAIVHVGPAKLGVHFRRVPTVPWSVKQRTRYQTQ